ncbi:MAG: hypothetical protein KKH47_02570 [Proteobacteria bacterium]|nr:hypothetical protein [Pseudomonadota bacterium]
MNLVEHFRRLFAQGPKPSGEEEVERLRAEFAARYRCFRDLLAANQRALEALAELEQAQAGEHGPAMAFVRGRATAVAVNVYRMIQNLEALAPDRYPGLKESFKAVQALVEAALGPAPTPQDGPLVLPLEQAASAGEPLAGPKMAVLGQVAAELGLATPPGLVITSRAYALVVEHNRLAEEIARLLQIADLERTDQLFATCSQVQGLFLRARIPPELARAVEEGLMGLAQRTPEPLRLAMRSSAQGEDAPGASFAGQFASELNVEPARWDEAYRGVIASLYSPPAVSYRRYMGLRDEDAAMAVGCLAMISARAGGVAYTADPLDPARQGVFISSCWGLPKAVVDGSWDCDQFRVAPGPPPRIAEFHLASKERRYVCDPVEGVLPVPVEPQLRRAPSLDEAPALELAQAARKLHQFFGGPQDVEWALDESGKLFILQCRPLPLGVGGEGQGAVVSGQEDRLLLRGGITASPGAAAGPVRWVQTGGDAVAFEEGDVLAVEQPLPRWAPLLGRAAALVGVKGGAAGHLASVAREFGVPALLGVGPEARALVPGREVTVDAGGRAVYAGRLALPGRPVSGGGLPDTPVRRVLAQVLMHAAPLNLLDPEDPGFAPTACRTLHDLTRFCHQKAVEEMFSQVAQEHFPLHAARQLYYHAPMQWWILDLDDGLRRPLSGKYARLEDILCAPFHAFWEGLVEVPWDGPPPLDAKGMASVMFQATANPALATGVKSRLAERNYFLITREFFNLQSRVGFHFSSVEAMVTPRAADNLVSFCFRGGAADSGRRRARLEFLEGFLAGLGMAMSIKGDALLARAEELPAPQCLRLVKALGYLIMHTRQLDMIMASPQRVEHYRAKIAAELAGLKPPAAASGGS